MNRRKAITLLLILCMAVGSLSGCGQEASSEEETKIVIDKPQIGITFDTFVLERWLKDRDVFVATAQKLGAEVDVQNANGDVSKQIHQIQQFVENKVDVIVVVAVDCYAVKDAVDNARNHGIEVISYDRMIQGTTTDLYISVDNEKVGQEMANVMCTKVPENGNVAMICGPEMDTNSSEVAKGFEAGVQASGLNIVKKIYTEKWTSEYGTEAISEILQEYPDIDGVMCGNDGLAGFVIQELSERQLAGKVIVTGQDADLEACQRVVEGTQAMTVYKPIEELAKCAAEFAVELADKGTVKDVKDTMKNDTAEIPYYGLEPIAVTKENMDEVIVNSGFHLRDEVYLNVE